LGADDLLGEIFSSFCIGKWQAAIFSSLFKSSKPDRCLDKHLDFYAIKSLTAYSQVQHIISTDKRLIAASLVSTVRNIGTNTIPACAYLFSLLQPRYCPRVNPN
jgi:hypothetical protein